ncbi:MAG: NUDIX domain-containing protein [Gammaproteobacteria bacterium]|nr:NUDIX domain-containing protein [Gammaproteobacteria bacterium]
MPPRLSAGVIVLHYRDTVPHYLVLRAHGHWDFPKGRLEPGETPLAAAIREVTEETTLTGLDFRWGHDYRETAPYRQHKVARYYVAHAPTMAVDLPVSPELGYPEHEEYRWLPYHEARGLLVERVQTIFDWAHQLITAGLAGR